MGRSELVHVSVYGTDQRAPFMYHAHACHVVMRAYAHVACLVFVHMHRTTTRRHKRRESQCWHLASFCNLSGAVLTLKSSTMSPLKAGSLFREGEGEGRGKVSQSELVCLFFDPFFNRTHSQLDILPCGLWVAQHPPTDPKAQTL